MKKLILNVWFLLFLSCVKSSYKDAKDSITTSTIHNFLKNFNNNIKAKKKFCFHTPKKLEQIISKKTKKAYSLLKLIIKTLLLKNIILCKSQNIEANLAFSFGSNGTNPGQFDGPLGISVKNFDGSNDSLYVVDYFNNRVQIFSLDGVFKFLWNTNFPLLTEFILQIPTVDIGLFQNLSLWTNTGPFTDVDGKSFNRFNGNFEYDLNSTLSTAIQNIGIDIFNNQAIFVGGRLNNNNLVPSLFVYNISEESSKFISSQIGLDQGFYWDIKIDDNIGYITFNDESVNSFQVVIYDILSEQFISSFTVGDNLQLVSGIDIFKKCIFVAVNQENGGFIRIFTKNGTFVKDFGDQDLILPLYITSDSKGNVIYISDSFQDMIFAYNISGSCIDEPTTTTTSSTTTSSTTSTTFMPNSTTPFSTTPNVTTSTFSPNFTSSTSSLFTTSTKKPLPQCNYISSSKEDYHHNSYIKLENRNLYLSKQNINSNNKTISGTLSKYSNLFLVSSIILFAIVFLRFLFHKLIIKYKNNNKKEDTIRNNSLQFFKLPK